MPRFLGESYPVGIGRKALTAATRKALLVAAEMRSEGSDVRFVKSTFVPAEDALICLFDAPSAELVIELGRRAGLPIERVVEAVELAAHDAAKTTAATGRR
jgi:hypothetical protein